MLDDFAVGLARATEIARIGQIRRRGQYRHQHAPELRQPQQPRPAVREGFGAMDQLLGLQPLGQLGDRAAAQAQPQRQMARHRRLLVELAQHHRFGARHAELLRPQAQLVEDAVTHVMQPIREV